LGTPKKTRIIPVRVVGRQPRTEDPNIKSPKEIGVTKKVAKFNQVKILSYVILIMGLFFFVPTFLFNSLIGALVGVSLTFLGALLLYLRSGDYTRKTLDFAISASYVTLNQLVQEFGYKGDAVYLPPKYFANQQTTKICITKEKNGELPKVDQTRMLENNFVGMASQVMFLTPSGMKLSKLLEKNLGKKFINTTLEDLQKNLRRVLVEDCEIAKDFEMRVAENFKTTRTTSAKNMGVHVTITGPARGVPLQQKSSHDCPICSAVAIGITKATGKPVRVAYIDALDGDILEANFSILEE